MEYKIVKVDECTVSNGMECVVISKDGKIVAFGEGRNVVGFAEDIRKGWKIEGIGIVVDDIDDIVAIR